MVLILFSRKADVQRRNLRSRAVRAGGVFRNTQGKDERFYRRTC